MHENWNGRRNLENGQYRVSKPAWGREADETESRSGTKIS